MHPKQMPTFEACSSMSSQSRNLNQNQRATEFDARETEQSLPKFSSHLDNSFHQSNQAQRVAMNWDPRAVLNSLDILGQKIHQIQDIVRSTLSDERQLSIQPNEFAAQQQLINTDLTCTIIELISTAGTLLPLIKNALASGINSSGQIGGIANSASDLDLVDILRQNDNNLLSEGTKDSEYEELIKGLSDWDDEGMKPISTEDNDVKDNEDGVSGENLPLGSYEVLQLEKEEILAPHTHFCAICGKGFKRDANLRMHMRGHGDEYKSPSALAKPSKEGSSEPVPIKRYSCPFIGCKRNKEHKNFQPLKTILCVKNHYKRSHCDKSYTCRRCNSKKFSVMADLKTHEKHCGSNKWLCSCGTTFSRKDKLFGHIALFQGHTPALSMDEVKSQGMSVQGQSDEVMAKEEDIDYLISGNVIEDTNFSGLNGTDNDLGYFSSMNFDSFTFGGIDGLQQPSFDTSESLFSFHK
ncbi:unnamed protein product [Musa banksii]